MPRSSLAVALLAPALALAAAASPPSSTFLVHRLSAAHARPAAWARTKCGSPSKGAAQPDIISSYGTTITPDSVATAFGYPRPQMARDEDTTFTNLNGLVSARAALSNAPPLRRDAPLPPFPSLPRSGSSSLRPALTTRCPSAERSTKPSSCRSRLRAASRAPSSGQRTASICSTGSSSTRRRARPRA